MHVVSGRASATAMASVVESLPPLCNSHGEPTSRVDSLTASHSRRWYVPTQSMSWSGWPSVSARLPESRNLKWNSGDACMSCAGEKPNVTSLMSSKIECGG